jgi:hypothetical protein
MFDKQAYSTSISACEFSPELENATALRPTPTNAMCGATWNRRLRTLAMSCIASHMLLSEISISLEQHF